MFQCAVPPPPLSKHVKLLWCHEGYSPATARERLLPTGTVELVFDLSDRPARVFRDESDGTGAWYRGGIVCGPHARYFVLDTSTPQTVAGIHFHAGGASRFFREPMCEIRDQHVSLETFWGAAAAASVRDRLLEATSIEARLRVLEVALLEKALRPVGETRNKAVDYALRSFAADPTVERVTDRLGLSARRFIELFNEETGLTPKLYCRVLRFQTAIQRAQTGLKVNWSALAVECGYFDQSHFIHDFKVFSGLSPSQYAGVRGPHLNHVPLT